MDKARQVSCHPAWIRENVDACRNTDILPVLVTPAAKVKRAALPHLASVALWHVDEFKKWAHAAIAAVRKLRQTFTEPGDLAWRAEAAVLFQQNCIDAKGLAAMLRAQFAKDKLQAVN